MSKRLADVLGKTPSKIREPMISTLTCTFSLATLRSNMASAGAVNTPKALRRAADKKATSCWIGSLS